jgi:uncharacterized membrane protein YdjX (TVP38/TMEM64 family)
MSVSVRDNRRKLAIGTCLVAMMVILFIFISPYISFEYIDTQRARYLAYYASQPLLVFGGFTLLMAVLIGLSLPVTGLTLILSGVLFGFPLGALAGGLACTLGGIFGFLWSRYLFRDFFQRRYRAQFEVVDRGVAREGWFYVFGLRLMMVFPYFLVNLLCALTGIRLATFVSATLASQLVVASLFAYAGSRLARIQEGADLFSPELILALFLVGIAPLVFSRLLGWARRRRAGGVA